MPNYSPHLKHIPRFTALTTWRLARADLQILRRQPDRSLHAEVLGLRALDQFGADFLQGGDFAGGQGDADFVDFGRFAELRGLFGVLEGHLDVGWLGSGGWFREWMEGAEFRSRLVRWVSGMTSTVV